MSIGERNGENAIRVANRLPAELVAPADCHPVHIGEREAQGRAERRIAAQDKEHGRMRVVSQARPSVGHRDRSIHHHGSRSSLPVRRDASRATILRADRSRDAARITVDFGRSSIGTSSRGERELPAGGTRISGILPAPMEIQDPPQGGSEHAFPETVSFDSRDALSDEPAALDRGSTVDRYVILEQVGGGAMGVVYAAYDPRLDRRVALKFLRQCPARASVRRQRLVREAQAMARLSHPNVAVVYEVGAVGDHMFVAMEFVDGVDLRAWLQAASRSRAAIVELFIAVGRGLAAAHAAGIVHRDFKPENVLVDRQGRARVTDFGIARVTREGDEQAAGRPELAADAAPADGSSRSLTVTGAVLGTPSYMAPEQHLGTAADARADQFAFCVALYEAVTGLRPFRGSSSAELLDAIVTRRRIESEMPRWLRAALLRGLEPDPRDRWPGMDALLAALARRPDRRRRRWFAGGAVAAGVGLLAWSLLAESRQIEPCPPARDRVADIWAAPVRERVRATFLATGAPGARAVFERADRALQERVTSWVTAHRDACRATRVSGEQSEALLDLRMQCLERARRQIAALPALWLEQVNLNDAVKAALTVGELDACGDADSLTAVVPAPRDPEGVRALESLRRALDRVAALQRAGRLADALAPAREAIARARRLGYPPILAEALHRGGQLEIDSGDFEVGLALLHEAFRAASEAHDDARAATTMRLVLYYSAMTSKHLAETDVLSKVAEAAVARVSRHDDLMADLLGTQGVVA
ncbi:MAG TPA: serine/threonine-protein kinase, partial [Kofleriaceae bacterium]|nr:serine/threonine-protein kinase [Kofleriaceae bacterium]